MAGDWIKMRVWLRRDPRVASMADFLSRERAFMDYVSDPVQRTCTESAYEHITRDITRAITVCALLEIWGVARERGDRDGDDLVLKHCDLNNLDDICSVPSMGEALEYVDWVSQEFQIDKRGRQVSYVRFPKFFSENEAPEDRYKKQHAEAQARYRAKKAAESDKNVDASGDVTRDITMTPREEKRRDIPNTDVLGKAPKKSKAEKTPQIAKPDEVAQQTWDDWLALRKAKGAPVTATVLRMAHQEAAKANMSLQDFLQIWCARGSQGLMADWIRPNEGRGQAPTETAYQRAQREAQEGLAPGVARRPSEQPRAPLYVIDTEKGAAYVPAIESR